MFVGRSSLARIAVVAGVAACSSSSPPESASPPEPESTVDFSDLPLHGLSTEEESAFLRGDELFDLPAREHDGLGPVYIRDSCGGCHAAGVRGPGVVQKMSVVLEDGITPAADQSRLPFGHTVRPLVVGGGHTPLVVPQDSAHVKVSIRVGPPIIGRGYMEAVLDAEIERVAAEQAKRNDGILGRVHRVVYASEPNADARFHQHKKGDVLIGRFGLKARVATLDDFTADALQGDMGLTSPLRPNELPNPDGLQDDAKPGIDLTLESLNARAMYMRLLAIPARRGLPDRGRDLFANTQCAVCHVPSLRTREDYPIRPLAGIDAPVFTDFLLHDMGSELADGLPPGADGDASGREWKTAPLIGLRFNRSFMHDGRARTVKDAILMHGGPGSQAANSVRMFSALSAADQTTLLDYVERL